VNRLTSTFLLLLGVATLASGTLWKRLEALLTGQGTAPDIVLAIGSAALLALALAGLIRIVVYTAKTAPEATGVDRQEEDHERAH